VTLRSLPRIDATWEIGEITAPMEGVRSIFIVVESPADTVRLVTVIAAGGSAGPLLRAAMEAPMGEGKPGRPTDVMCRDAGLLADVRTVLQEADVRGTIVGSLPVLDRVMERLSAPTSPNPAPGITVDVGGWRQTLDTLLGLAPWTVLDDQVRFTYTGAGLDGAVGVLLGHTGAIFGFSLYDSVADLDRFLASAASPTLPDIHAAVLHIEPAADLSASEVDDCVQVGLELGKGQFPRVFGLVAQGVTLLDDAAQRRLRLAVEAVLAVSTGKLQSIARGDEVSTRIRRPAGVVEVTALRVRA
jgi:hypothetical protein